MNNRDRKKQGIEIEICCGGLDDVIESARGGAHRIELNAALELGGLTPSLGTLSLSRAAADLEIIAMLRPRGGGFCYSEKEFKTMLADLPLLLENGADGLAFGILTPDGELDDERCKIILDEMDKFGGRKKAVFHMAFDDAKTEEIEMLSRLELLGFARVLTKGRAENAISGAEALRRYVEFTRSRGMKLEILPGGGVRPHNACEIVEKTDANQLHGKLHKNFGGEVDVVDSDELRKYVVWAESYQA